MRTDPSDPRIAPRWSTAIPKGMAAGNIIGFRNMPTTVCPCIVTNNGWYPGAVRSALSRSYFAGVPVTSRSANSVTESAFVQSPTQPVVNVLSLCCSNKASLRYA